MSGRAAAPVYDVIVVGAGPAGTTCARELAVHGANVLLLERDATPGESANCTGIVGREAFHEMGIPWSLARSRLHQIRFVGPRGRRLDFARQRPLAGVVRRSEFDSYLAREAVGRGVELLTGTAVREIDLAGEHVRVRTMSTPSTSGHEFMARALVLALGYNVSLLRQAGFEAPAGFVQGAQVLLGHPGIGLQVAGGEAAVVFLGSRLVPHGFGWYVPVGPDRAKVGVAAPTRAVRYLGRVGHCLEREYGLDVAGGRLRTSPIPTGSAPRSVSDRVMLVGECAGQVKVTSHGGIYYGMLGARIAAETLAEALARDGLSAEALQSYESRWRDLIEPEIQAGLWLRRRLGGAGDLLLGGLMSLGRIPGVMRWIESHADFDWHRGLIDAGRARLSWSPTPAMRPRILDPSSAGGR